MGCFDKNFKSKNFHLLKCFSNKFYVFGLKRIYLYLFSRVGKIKEKESLFEIGFWIFISISNKYFFQVFFFVFSFQTLYFLTLELSIYPIYRILFLWEIGLWFIETTKCCNLFVLSCRYPSCVEVIVEEYLSLLVSL